MEVQVEQRHILRVMPDWFCSPLWNKRAFTTDDALGEYNITPESLPITAELADAVLRWAARMDATLNDDYPPDSRFPTDADERSFVNDGRVLATRLAVELGEDWCVTYYYDLTRNASGPITGDEQHCIPIGQVSKLP